MTKRIKEDTVEAVDCVLRMLTQEHHKETVTDHLFPNAQPDYRDEWLERDAFRFWCHLDEGNRLKVVRFCVRYYNET